MSGKPQYIPGESMTSYNARLAQWLKTNSSEKGTQASFVSKNKQADTGTNNATRVGQSDSGSFENAPTESNISYDANAGAYQGTQDDGSYDAAPAQGGYQEGGYQEGGYEEGGYEEQYYEEGGYEEGYEEEGYYEEGY